jgi:hypothetical protein
VIRPNVILRGCAEFANGRRRRFSGHHRPGKWFPQTREINHDFISEWREGNKLRGFPELHDKVIENPVTA